MTDQERWGCFENFAAVENWRRAQKELETALRLADTHPRASEQYFERACRFEKESNYWAAKMR